MYKLPLDVSNVKNLDTTKNFAEDAKYETNVVNVTLIIWKMNART